MRRFAQVFALVLAFGLAPWVASALPATKSVICHATHSSKRPYVAIEVGATGASAHLASHPDDFEWDPTRTDEPCTVTTAPRCGDTSAAAARSCRAILDDCGARPDGVYWIDPSGSGAAFEAYCDMTRHGGGWMLVAALGESANPSDDFRTDVNLAALLAPVPAPGEYAHLDLARFDAYGSDWTVRATVDTSNDLSHFQDTFWRSAPATPLLPSEAGTNWKGTLTYQSLLHLTTSSTTGSGNVTWLPAPDCIGGHCDGSMFLWTYRDPFGGGDCLLATDQTRVCHSVQGTVVSDFPVPGSMSAAFGMLDGVSHDWFNRATYWLKDVNADGAP